MSFFHNSAPSPPAGCSHRLRDVRGRRPAGFAIRYRTSPGSRALKHPTCSTSMKCWQRTWRKRLRLCLSSSFCATSPIPPYCLPAPGCRLQQRKTRRAELYRALTAHAERTQAPLRAWLDARGVRYTPHYLVNMIEVQGDQALADQLRLRPEVDRLARNPAVRQTEALPASRSASTAAALGRCFATARSRGRPSAVDASSCRAYPAAVWPGLHGG